MSGIGRVLSWVLVMVMIPLVVVMKVRPLDGGGFGAVTASGPAVRARAGTRPPAPWRRPAGYSDEELRLLLEFQRKLVDIVRGQLARLRGDLDQHVPSGG
jgi:hypothetical protein